MSLWENRSNLKRISHFAVCDDDKTKQEALAKVEEVLTEINEAKRLMENAEKIAELAST